MTRNSVSPNHAVTGCGGWASPGDPVCAAKSLDVLSTGAVQCGGDSNPDDLNAAAIWYARHRGNKDGSVSSNEGGGDQNGHNIRIDDRSTVRLREG
jgi:hypothetical protein